MVEPGCYGLDFGTSSIKLCQMESDMRGKPRPVLLSSGIGGKPMPTAVTVREDGAVIVGDLSAVRSNPKRSFLSFKSIMRDPDSGLLNPPICNIDGQTWDPQRLISEVLRSVVDLDDDGSKNRINISKGSDYRITMSIPVHFGQNECDAMTQAAEEAHIDGSRVSFIDEPLAAAIGLGDRKTEGLTLLADIGAGTLDLVLFESIAERTLIPSRIERMTVIAKRGVPLGGDDFDNCIVAELARLFEDRLDFNASKLLPGSPPPVEITNSRWYYPLKLDAQALKEELCSRKDSTEPLVRLVSDVEGVGERKLFRMSMSSFETICRVPLAQINGEVRQFLDRNGLSPFEIVTVYLVGGSSQVPAVRNIMTSIFQRGGQVKCEDPILAIAKGSTIRSHDTVREINAGMGQITTLIVKDITKHSYGIFDHELGEPVEIIRPGVSLATPVQDQKHFGTRESMQDNVRIEPWYRAPGEDSQWRPLHSNGKPVVFCARIDPDRATGTDRFIAYYQIEQGEKTLNITIHDTLTNTDLLVEKVTIDRA